MPKESTMRYRLLILILSLCLTIPLHAQHELSPYEIALQRIEEARISGATILNISEIGLIELPPQIGQLTQLQELWVRANGLTVLPSEIGQLTTLQILYLDDNQLIALPAEIGQLSNLEKLVLSQNQISELPPEIGQLNNLQSLTLYGNQLQVLPPEIGQLTNLFWLSLSHNNLQALPSEIGQLSKLEFLLLDGNQLRTLPSEIGHLNNICSLSLQNNNLHHLPNSLGQLTNLIQFDGCTIALSPALDLTNNPLISPPPEVVEQGTAAVLAYLRHQAWYHVQRLIIGAASGVGLLALLVLGWRVRQQRGKSKKKRDAA